MAWHCKPTDGYVADYPVTGYPDSDGEENCLEMWSILQSYGWTAEAAAGVLTCMALESEFNPWRWQGGVASTTNYKNFGVGRAYGLLQWDPASYLNVNRYHYNKYIDNPYSINLPGYGPNFSDQPGSMLDGQAQTIWLATKAWSINGIDKDYFRSDVYPYYGYMEPEFSDYKVSTRNPADLATVWVVNYQRPSDPMGRKTIRDNLAPLLYQLITGSPPPPPPPTGIPVWLLLKWRQNQIGGKGYI